MILILLQGGLGNQLFQISLASLLVKLYPHQQIIVEHRTGFLLDFHYRRQFEVKAICELASLCTASNCLSALSFFYRLLRKLGLLALIKPFAACYSDDSLPTNPVLAGSAFTKGKNYIISGWFQDARYVINSPLPFYLYKYLNKSYSSIALPDFNSNNCFNIAACLRLYEEAHDIQNHTKSGLLPSATAFYNAIIKAYSSSQAAKVYFVGQSHYTHFEYLSFLDHKYWTSEDGIKSPFLCIYAISRMDCAIITSSTLYFWGAYMMYLRKTSSTASPGLGLIYYSRDFNIKSLSILPWSKF